MTRPVIRAAAFSLITLVGAGCSDDARRLPDDTEVVLESIDVTAPALMSSKGEEVRFTATGSFSDGSTKDLTTDVTWSSSDAKVASIDASGLVSALEPGTTQIEAASGDVTGAATFTVTPANLESLAVEPREATVAPGESERLVAVATLADGSTMAVTAAVVWSSSDESVATVTAGEVTGVAPGAAVISALDMASGIGSDDGDRSATVTVREAPPTAITVTPSNVALALGMTEQLTATAMFADGSMRDVTAEVTWSSSAPDVATVSSDAGSVGLVTPLSEGFASIVAVHEASGLQGVATVRVGPPEIMTIAVTPSAVTLEVNATQGFEAMGTYTDGSERSVTASVMWTSSDPAVATVSNEVGRRGLATPVTTGTVTISAVDPQSGVSSDDSASSATLAIVPPQLVSVTVLPATPNIPVGLSVQMQAFGIYSDNSGQEITGSVIWSSSNQAVAMVDAFGNVTAVSTGTAAITATEPVSGISSDDDQSSSFVTVDPPILLSIAVTPPTASMVVGSDQQFTATGQYSDGVPRDISTQVDWSSSSPSLSISPTGFASAVATGNVTVTATDPGSGVSSDDSNQSATALISDAVLLSLEVTPATSTVPPGADLQLTALGSYNNGATVDLTSIVTWSSLDPAVAVVSNAAGSRGVASVLAPGVTTFSVFEPFSGVGSDDSNQSATLSVPAGVTLQSVAVTPASMVINVNQTFAFQADGTFSDASVHPMTNSVTWSSSNPMVATMSNIDGSRGEATGAGVGTSMIAATHAASGISSDDSAQSAALTVELGIVIADIVHYDLEEGSGTTLTNAAPGQPAGTINGTATWNTPGTAPGGGTFRLTMADGGSNFVNPNLPSTTYTNLTIEFWWRYNSGTGLAYMWNSGPSFRAFTNGVANNGFYVRETPGGGDVIHTGNVQDGNWHHFAYVLDAAAGQGRLYVDGVLSDTTTYSGSIALGGSWYLLGQNGAHGALIDYDRYRVWSTALTAAEVAEVVAGNR